MNSQKRKHFAPKKEDSWLMGLILSSCFSFQTRTDLVLVKSSTMQQFDVFWKLLENLQGNNCDGNHFSESLSYSKWAQVRAYLSISFPNKFLWLLPNIEQKLIPLNDNIVWCKYSRVIKNLSKSGSFFLLNAPKYLGARLFYSLYARTLRIFWNVVVLSKRKENNKKKIRET